MNYKESEAENGQNDHSRLQKPSLEHSCQLHTVVTLLCTPVQAIAIQ